MTSENPMEGLYERLADAGMSRHFVKKNVLPDWWDDRIARNPVGLQQACGYVSKHLGLELGRLKDKRASLRPKEAGQVRLKVCKGVVRDDLSWAMSLAVRAAEMAAYAMEAPYRPVADPTHIRETILEGSCQWLNLEALLDFCWEAGIPVLHIAHFPQGTKKMTGMAVMTGGRPVIVLSKKHRHEAWLSFICAHELGHVGCGHLAEGEPLADVKLDLSSENEKEESEANEFAAALLADDIRFVTEGFTLKTEQLVETARDVASKHEIAPGIIVLNYVWNLNQKTGGNYYPLANKALSMLYPDAGGAEEKVRRTMMERLPLGNLPEESARFLLRLTGVEDQRERDTASVA